MKRAIVVGCHINGFGVIRSLGLKGFQTIAMSYDNTDFGHFSKHVYEKVKVPHPLKKEAEFIKCLVDSSHKSEGALILDAGDIATISISKNRNELIKHYKVVAPEWDVLRKFIQKPETYVLAEKCNIPYPKTVFLKTPDELHKVKDGITYPCILKPVLGHEFMDRFNSKNFKISNYEELLSKFKFCLESGQDVMIQEIIPGPDSNIYECTIYINSKGDVSATFLSRKLRQNPPQFGVARVAISHDMVPEIEEFTQKILKEAGFRGIAHAEFKMDPRDNQFKLLEVNGRTLRSNWLTTYCGVNFPWIIYMDLVENKQVEVRDYKKGVYWIDLYADVLNTVLRSGKEGLGFRDYIKPYLSKDSTFAVVSAGDLMPFVGQVSALPVKFYRLLAKILR